MKKKSTLTILLLIFILVSAACKTATGSKSSANEPIHARVDAGSAEDLQRAGWDMDVDADIRETYPGPETTTDVAETGTVDGDSAGANSTLETAGVPIVPHVTGHSSEPAISANGRFVAFISTMPLVSNTNPNARSIFVRDTENGSIELINRRMDGQPPTPRSDVFGMKMSALPDLSFRPGGRKSTVDYRE